MLTMLYQFISELPRDNPYVVNHLYGRGNGVRARARDPGIGLGLGLGLVLRVRVHFPSMHGCTL